MIIKKPTGRAVGVFENFCVSVLRRDPFDPFLHHPKPDVNRRTGFRHFYGIIFQRRRWPRAVKRVKPSCWPLGSAGRPVMWQ